MGEPQMAGNVDEYQGWNTLPARPSFNPEPSFSGGFAQPSSPCSGWSPSITMWHRSLPKPLGRSLRHSLLKSLLTATARTWPNASAPAYPTACSYAHACSYAPAYATWELRLWGLWP